MSEEPQVTAEVKMEVKTEAGRRGTLTMVLPDGFREILDEPRGAEMLGLLLAQSYDWAVYGKTPGGAPVE